jgi:hypothetical protein
LTEKNHKFLRFDVESAEIVEDNPDSRFMTAKIQAFSSGENLHNLICTEETLKRTASTIYNVPVIYNIVENLNNSDFGTHTDPEKSLIAGFIVPGSATFDKLDDGRISLNVLCKLSKRYAPKVVKILEKRAGNAKVSVEMELCESSKIDEFTEEMKDFIYLAVCLLGSKFTEASPSAHLEVLSFAKENEEYRHDYELEFSNKYADIDFTIPKKVKSSAKKSLDTYKEKGNNATSISLAMGRFLAKNEKATPEKIKMMAKFFNRKTLSDEITLGFFGGKEGARWCKEIMSAIDEIDNKQLSYFGEDEVVTFPYTSIDKAPENMKKLDGVHLLLIK